MLGAERLTERQRIGRRAEAVARDYLIHQGFAIIGANVRVGALEIDIVARQGSLLAIVEVRSRGKGAFQRALASVSATKRARLVSAADRLWRERFAADLTLERLRFDVIAVAFDGDDAEIEHVPAAFTA